MNTKTYQNLWDENNIINIPEAGSNADRNCNYYQNVIASPSKAPPLSESQLSLRCILCGMQTVSQRKMQEHMQFHSSTPSRPCDIEDDPFDEIPLQTIIHEEIPSRQRTPNKKRLLWQKYGWRLLDRKIIYCGICRKDPKITAFYNKATLSRHFLTAHFRGSIRCSCGCKFRHDYQLGLHRKGQSCCNVSVIL